MPSETKEKLFQTREKYLELSLDTFLSQVYNCALLNNLFWAVWALDIMTPETCIVPNVYNYYFDFASNRVEMFKKI